MASHFAVCRLFDRTERTRQIKRPALEVMENIPRIECRCPANLEPWLISNYRQARQQRVAGRIVHGKRRTEIRERQRDKAASKWIAARGEQAGGPGRARIARRLRRMDALRKRVAKLQATARCDRASRRGAIRRANPTRLVPAQAEQSSAQAPARSREGLQPGSLKLLRHDDRRGLAATERVSEHPHRG